MATGIIAGMLLGPLSFLMFFVSGVASSSEQQRKCPYCAEWIKPDAKVCKHCQRDVEPVAPAQLPKVPLPKPTSGYYGCPHCGRTVKAEAPTCQHCGEPL